MHNIVHWTFSEKCDRRAVQAECDAYAMHEDWQEGCSGVNPIRWLDITCGTYEEAEEKIKSLDKGWYDCLAVKFKQPKKDAEKPKAVINACEKMIKARDDYSSLKLKLANELLSAKSEFIGCKSCGSKLNRRRLSRPICPVCNYQLLSDTAQNRISAAEDRMKKAEAAYNDAEKASRAKLGKNGDTMWLVKFEYHT